MSVSLMTEVDVIVVRELERRCAHILRTHTALTVV